jgi:hypothetical protein
LPNPTYRAGSIYAGSDSFTYTMSDGKGGSDTATVTITGSNKGSGGGKPGGPKLVVSGSVAQFNAAVAAAEPTRRQPDAAPAPGSRLSEVCDCPEWPSKAGLAATMQEGATPGWMMVSLAGELGISLSSGDRRIVESCGALAALREGYRPGLPA